MCYLYDSYTDNASSNQTHGPIVQVQLVQAFWEILPLLFWSQCCSLPVSRLLCIVQSTFALSFVCIHSSYFSLYSPALLTSPTLHLSVPTPHHRACLTGVMGVVTSYR